MTMMAPDNPRSDAEGTPAVPVLVRLFDQLTESAGVDPHFGEALRGARAVLTRAMHGDGPFLTVLLRTQGQRIEPLKDALLCLSSQTVTDFEVLVLAHDVDAVAGAAINEIVAAQAPSFSAQVRVLDVRGGGRARPLNEGLKLARGRYIAAYDDDDLLFGNWVEEFQAAALRAEGKMLRAVVATQGAVPEMWPQDQDGFRASSWPKAEYAGHFDPMAHLEVNHSPFMAWAFPRTLFRTLGLRFDETLKVCEDWDMILRGSFLVGVEDVPALTAIYRRWEGGVSSAANHSRDEWLDSELRVVERLNDSALLFAPGAVEQVRAGQVRRTAIESDLITQLETIHGSRSWRAVVRVRHLLAPPRRLVGRALRALRLR